MAGEDSTTQAGCLIFVRRTHQHYACTPTPGGVLNQLNGYTTTNVAVLERVEYTLSIFSHCHIPRWFLNTQHQTKTDYVE